MDMSIVKNEAYYRTTVLEIKKETLKILRSISERLDSIEESLWSIRESLEKLCRVVWNK